MTKTHQHKSYNEVQPKAKFKSGKTQNQKHTSRRNRKSLKGTWDTGVLYRRITQKNRSTDRDMREHTDYTHTQGLIINETQVNIKKGWEIHTKGGTEKQHLTQEL